MISLAAMVLTFVIRLYQLLISPLLPTNCRYIPTCSAYALEAVKRFGAVRGGWLIVQRLGRCHPWGGHGYDPVPDLGDTCYPVRKNNRLITSDN